VWTDRWTDWTDMTEKTGTFHNYANEYTKKLTVRKTLLVSRLSDAKIFPDTNPLLHFGG
jgi:hypothetical protein